MGNHHINGNNVRLPLQRHFKSHLLQVNVNRIYEIFSTDALFLSVTAIKGETILQLFVGNRSDLTVLCGMQKESEDVGILKTCIKEWEASDCILQDNSKMQNVSVEKCFRNCKLKN